MKVSHVRVVYRGVNRSGLVFNFIDGEAPATLVIIPSGVKYHGCGVAGLATFHTVTFSFTQYCLYRTRK